MSSVVNTLVEMGFSKQHAEIAVKKTGSNDVQVAMDWLLSHEEQLDNLASEVPPEPAPSDETEKTDATDLKEHSPSPTASQDSSSAEAKSFRCDDCGKLFRTQDEVEFHAVKSGHGNFSESTEEKKPLSEEEKKEQLAKIEAKLRQRRLEREAREKEEALMREKIRIKSGKELQEAKRRQEELEMKKLMEQKRKEKEEEKLAKQRIREKIEQDKIARKAKFGGVATPEPATTPASPPPASAAPPTSAAPRPSPSEARLQIRLTDGSVVQHTFGAKEPLSAVRLFVEMKVGGTQAGTQVNLMTNFPKKVFAADDYEKPLETLDDMPSLTIEDFNRCVEDIVNISDKLMDRWKLEQNEGLENGKYIVKKEQKVLPLEQEDSTNFLLSFEYHVAFNISYGVPVLCFNVWKQDGTILTIEQFWKANKKFKDSNMYDTLTQMDHPVLRRPFLTLHLCRTHEIMEPFLERSKNPVVSWLTVVGPFVHLNLTEEYVKICSS